MNSLIVAAFFNLFAPRFLALSLIPIVLFLLDLLFISHPHWIFSAEWRLFKFVYQPVERGLLFICLLCLAHKMQSENSHTFDSLSQLSGLAIIGLESVSKESAALEDQTEANTNPRRRKCNKEKQEIKKCSKRICLPIEQEEYNAIVEDAKLFRGFIDQSVNQYPELFPKDIQFGYKLHGKLPRSKKMPEIVFRRIKLKRKDYDGKAQTFTIAPSFVMPYMTGYTDNIEKALFLHNKFGVSFWGLTYVFGRNDMYWYRLTTCFGRNNLVGTTVKSADDLPKNLLADEKHTKIVGQKAYIATTVGSDCILGASIAEKADSDHLTEAYRHFRDEAQQVAPNQSPQTVNTDGWSATILAWRNLYPSVVTVRCFLHGFIKIRSCSKKTGELFSEISRRVWNTYHSPNKELFLSNAKDLREWASQNSQNLTGTALGSIFKLCDRADEYAQAYDHPNAYRTSNMIDRHMEAMDRYLDSTRYFHGHFMSAEYSLRGWALMHNFQPYCPRAKVRQQYISPAHKLNGFVYRDNWLENLLVSASMGGVPS